MTLRSFSKNAINGAKLLEPALRGAIGILLKAAEGYSKIAAAVAIFQESVAKQQSFADLRAKENRTLTEQATLTVLLSERIKELTETAKKSNGTFSTSAQRLSMLKEELKLAEAELTKMSKAFTLQGNTAKTAQTEQVKNTKEIVELNQEVLRQNKLLEDSIRNQATAQADQFAFLKQVTEESILLEQQGLDRRLLAIDLETAELKSQAELRIQDKQILEDTLTQIEKNGLAKRGEEQALADSEARKRRKKRTQEEIDATVQLAQASLQVAASFAGESKEIAIASSLINTFQGVTKAYAQGGPLGFITGAAVLAAGLAQVNNIRKQNFQFGGRVEGPTSGDQVPVQANGGEVFLTREAQANIVNGNIQQQDSGKRELVIINPLGMFSDDEIAQKLANYDQIKTDRGITAQG